MRKLGQAFSKFGSALVQTEFDAARDSMREVADEVIKEEEYKIEYNAAVGNIEDTDLHRNLNTPAPIIIVENREEVSPERPEQLEVNKDYVGKYFSIQELEKHLILDLFLTYSSDGQNNRISIGEIPLKIYQQLLELAQDFNLFEVGYHPYGVWYALINGRLLWSVPIISTNFPITEEPVIKSPNKFNRYTALTKKEEENGKDVQKDQ